MTTLSVSGLTVCRGGRPILENLSLEACAGRFLAIIGPNGAGKSTLLAALAGLAPATRGLITLDGTPLKQLRGAPLARRLAYLPQSPRCEWPISVERLVALGLTPVLPAFGRLPEALQPQIDRVLAQCDLLDKRAQAATTLSGGELARAMLARALVGNPDVLIVDEPTAGLDPRHALDAAARLRALAKAGKLVIAALHDLTLVLRYATHTLALHGGRIVQEGTTATVMSAALLRTIYGVPARIADAPGGELVDFLPQVVEPADRPAAPAHF